MGTRTSVKLAVGTLATVATLLLTALPASANTATVTITYGTLDVGLFMPFELSDPGYDCLESPLGTELTFMEGSVTGVYQRRYVTDHLYLGPVLVDLYIGITGAWFPGSPETITGMASVQMEVTPAADDTDCTPEAGGCDVAISNLEIEGTFDGTLPTAAIGDVMVISGANDGETMVNPSEQVCGVLIHLDGWPSFLNDVWFEVTDVEP